MFPRNAFIQQTEAKMRTSTNETGETIIHPQIKGFVQKPAQTYSQTWKVQTGQTA